MTDTIDDDDYDPIYVHFTFDLKIVRIIENILLPTKLTVRAEILNDPDASAAEIDLAFTKVRFWFDSVASKCIMFNRHNKTAIDMLIDEEGGNRTGNILMILPDEPTEDVLAMVFQAKMCALAGGIMEFGIVEVKADSASGLAFTYCGDHSLDLPTMDEWMSEPNWFDRPWWNRNDASTLDVIPPDDADLTQKPTWAYSLDFLAGFSKPTELEGGAAIVRAEFKPTVIDGGKK